VTGAMVLGSRESYGWLGITVPGSLFISIDLLRGWIWKGNRVLEGLYLLLIVMLFSVGWRGAGWKVKRVFFKGTHWVM